MPTFKKKVLLLFFVVQNVYLNDYYCGYDLISEKSHTAHAMQVKTLRLCLGMLGFKSHLICRYENNHLEYKAFIKQKKKKGILSILVSQKRCFFGYKFNLTLCVVYVCVCVCECVE